MHALQPRRRSVSSSDGEAGKFVLLCPITFDIDRENSVVERYLSLIKELPGSELLAILRIEEPDTYKIDEDSLPVSV